MGRIPDQIIQQIRERVDLVDLVGRFVTLKKAGRNYKGLCPFHGEKTPSFNVNPDRQAFYCFGCQEGGNAITFLMKIEGLSFPEAARALARERGIEIPETDGGERGLSERLFEANEVAQAAYRAALATPGNPALAYLERRGVDAASIERFGIGFAPDRWDFVAQRLREKGIPAELGERAGILAPRTSGGHYDRLRGRVTFPIRDTRGRILGFGGRALGPDQEPKYLNTPESPVFRKREAFYGFPFALDPIRRGERVVVVEGYFDLIALHRAGVEATLATCGTALSADHAQGLKRRSQQVVLFFDGDEAGQRAMERALQVLLPEGLRLSAALLPAGEDPDSILRVLGAEHLRKLVDEAVPALDRVMARAVERGRSTPVEKARAVAEVAPLLALIPSPVEMGAFARLLALRLDVDPQHVDAAVRAVKRGENPLDVIPIAPRRTGPEERILHEFALNLVHCPGLVREISSDDLDAALPSGAVREIVEALAAGDGRGTYLEAASERLSESARPLLWRLAAVEEAPDETVARRVVVETLAWFRKRRLAEKKRALTRQMHEPDADPAALLGEKQRQLDEERLLAKH
ncbi:MAG TPA: DNA primase [Myxococcota bacterium]